MKISGFRIRRRRGRAWRRRVERLLGEGGVVGFMKGGVGPWWIEVYMRREYAAVRNPVVVRRGRVSVFHDKMLVIRRISLKRLSEGGAAMLAAVKINHHGAMEGAEVRRPLIRMILRVFVAS